MRTLLIATALLWGCIPSKSQKTERITSSFELPTRRPPKIKPAPKPGFIAFDSFEDSLVLDAQSLSAQDAADSFYLVGCDRSNIDEELEEFKRGVDKAVNMLSTERFLEPTTAIGPSGCIFRISQDAYGISDIELDKIAARGLFTVVSNTTRGDTIKFYLQRSVTWMFADDFFLTSFEADVLTDHSCDTYCDITEQAIGRIAFFAQQGINPQNEYNNENVFVGGTNDSPIAFGSRLIEHFESDNGFLTATADSSLGQPDSINQNPFTLEESLANSNGVGAPITNKIFKPVAREYIGVLNNGLQLFRLEDAATGLAVSAAPADVVQDTRGDGLEQVIRLGGCAGCHSKGTIGYTDELADHIASRSNFNSDEKELSRIFNRPVPIAQILSRIDEGQSRAVAQLGIQNRDRDPFNARLITPARKPYNSVKAAAKFFMTDQQYRDCLESGNDIAQNLGAHLGGAQNTTTLTVLHDNFQGVIDECGLFQDDEI